MEPFVMAAKKKMKRKDLDQVNDDFSDFSLSSPARKIRRLDAELPPIMEDEDLEPLMSFEQPNPEVQPARSGPVIEELPPSSAPFNEERALVLFKPVNSPLLQHHQSPSTLSVSVDPHLISGFKNHNLWASLTEQSSEDNAEAAADSDRNKCMAVVPWVANQFTTPTSEPQVEAAEEMEAEESGEATMEIDDSCTAEQLPNQYGELRGSDASGLPQWQHCMTPQFPPTTSSPIVWFR